MNSSVRLSIPASQTPPAVSDFIAHVERAMGQRFADYARFEDFAIRDFRRFWRCFLDWSGIVYSGDADPVCTDDDCERAVFFPHVRLNLVENLLAIRDPKDAARPALTSLSPSREPVRLTRGELRGSVDRLAYSLAKMGVSSDWRIAMVAQSDQASVIAALAAAGLGALVATGSPDLSAEANLARLSSFQPQLLFCHLSSPFEKTALHLRGLATQLVSALPSLRVVVALDGGEAPGGWRGSIFSLDELIAAGQEPFAWPRHPFNQPYTVLFTSGTSGPPRGLVHGGGGPLLEHLKAHLFHYDLRPSDKIFWQASTAWVLWRFHLSMLAVGAEIVINSAPVSHPETLWRIVAEEAVTVFGATPAYLKLCELQGYVPREHFDFRDLRSMIGAGSNVEQSHQDWVRSAVKPIVARSGYGSTDTYTGVILPAPLLPDIPGQLQARGLGLDVRVVRQGESSFPKPAGELIIANPFPSKPMGYFDDPGGSRFHADYFVHNQPCFSLGDFAEFTPEGGFRILGRCDSVMNIRGIRIGPGEIYGVLRDVPEIAAAAAVSQSGDEPGGERLVLLVVLQRGLQISDQLTQTIRDLLRRRLSATYVPEVIAQVTSLPLTHNGKLSERSVADAVCGRPVANLSALSNPQCIDEIAAHPALLRRQAPQADVTPATNGQPDIEEAITSVWKQVLGRPAVGRDEDFFDAGGDSMRAIEAFAQLERVFGARLPISILHQAGTIAKLAALVDKHVTPTADTLVRFTESAGPQPFFMVHGLGGHVMELRPLLRAVSCPGPIFGLQARGVTGQGEPQRTVDEMARTYVDAIRAVQSQGPYLMGGYSLGGLVAIEMARILLSEGQQVLPLVIVDSLIESRYWRTSDWLRMLWYKRNDFYDDLRGAGAGKLLRTGATRIGKLIERIRRRYDHDVRRRFASFYEPDGWPAPMRAVKEAGVQAVAAYQPRYLDHPIHFIKAERGALAWCNPSVIWSPYVRSVSVSEVTGDHLSMITPPHRDGLARALTEFIGTTVSASA